MATYEVTDPTTGRKVRLTGDSPPTEQELEQIFANLPPIQERSFMERRVREQGLGLRNVLEGVPSIITAPSDLIGRVADYGLEKLGTNFRFGSSSAALSNLLTKYGLPEPETEAERTVSAVGRGISSVPGFVVTGGAMAGAASPVTAGVGETLAANPIMQTASAATGATGAEIARRSGYGPVGQIVGGLIGAAVPAVATSAVPAMVRGAFRGGETGRNQVAENIDTFRGAGTTPTVGQATQGRVNQAAEGLLSRAPGGAGVMARTAEEQADDVGRALEEQARKLAGRAVSAEQAGRTISASIKGEGGFIEKFRAAQDALYDKLDNFIAPDKPVTVANTQKALAELTTPIRGAEETTRRLVNPKIAAIAEGLSIDAQSGVIPYEALKQLRTRIGAELDNGLVSDVPAAQWKRLYSALSQDLRVAADTPEAMSAWTRANTFTSAGMKRLEAIESVVNRNGGPEAVFRAATSGTKEGASTLRAVMQSLDDQGQRTVTATVLRRLGLAKAGVQGELGDRFSSETFLTNWNLLSQEARRTLFNRYGDTFRSDMDRIARFAANLREGAQVFRNPSGTAQASAQIGTATAFVTSVALGRLDAAALIAGGVVGANLSARLLTNPRFVHWLAQSTAVPKGSYAAMVERLLQQAQKNGDADLAAGALLLQQQNQEQPEQAPGQQ